jgi:hypothetical protein
MTYLAKLHERAFDRLFPYYGKGPPDQIPVMPPSQILTGTDMYGGDSLP